MGDIKFANRTRYVVLVLATATLTLVFSNSLAFNFTNICMKQEPITTTVNSDLWNHTETKNNASTEKDLYSKNEVSALFSAVPLGTLIGTIFITYLTAHIGFRKMFVLYGMLSAFATLLTPLAVGVGLWAMFVVRVVQGIAISTSFVAMGAVSAEWSPMKSSGLYISWISCHLQFGPMFVMPVAGTLCSTTGWRSVYYLLGALSVVSFTLFYYFFRDSPRFQRNVSEKELTKIETGKTAVRTTKTEIQYIPYRHIITDLVMWGVIFSSTVTILALFFMMQFGPDYLHKVLGLPVGETGIAAAIPFALSALLKVVSGPVSDRMSNYISDKANVIIFSSISQFAMAGCYLALAFLPAEQISLMRLAFTLIIMFSGLSALGYVKGAHLAARHCCHVIMAWCTMASSVLNLLLPPLVSWVAPNNTVGEWSRLFIAIAVMIVTTSVFFITTIEADARPWTKLTTPPAKCVEKPLQCIAAPRQPRPEGVRNDASEVTETDGPLRTKKIFIVADKPPKSGF